MTNPELAILSLIAERPCHGYEIEQIIEERGMREWTEVGFSSIYYLLKKLEQSGWIESRLESAAGRGPARRVYSITASGRKAWKEAALKALAEPQRCFTPFQLGLSNLAALPPAEALAALRQYQVGLEERMQHVKSRKEEQPGLPFHVEAMFELSLAKLQAERDWLVGFIESLEKGAA